MSHVIFSKRREIAKKALTWCIDNGVSTDAFGIVTALNALGFLSDEMPAIMDGNGHPDEAPCVICGAVFDTHEPECVFGRLEEMSKDAAKERAGRLRAEAGEARWKREIQRAMDALIGDGSGKDPRINNAYHILHSAVEGPKAVLIVDNSREVERKLVELARRGDAAEPDFPERDTWHDPVEGT